MKKFPFILFALCFITFTACSVFDNEQVNSPLVGKWQWVRTTGGFAGRIITPDSVGHGAHIIFKSNHAFSAFVADTLVRKGKYH